MFALDRQRLVQKGKVVKRNKDVEKYVTNIRKISILEMNYYFRS